MLETREQAWIQLHDAMHDQINLARREWPEDLEERIEEANRFLDENPAPAEGEPEPVQIVLSPRSLGQVEQLLEANLAPYKESVERLRGAVELITEMADARELWTTVLTADSILLKDGERVDFTTAQKAWLRDALAKILMFGGQPDYLTEQLGPPLPKPVIPPMPPVPAMLPSGYPAPPGYVTPPPQMVAAPAPEGVTVAVVDAPMPQYQEQPVQGQSPLAAARARRAQMPVVGDPPPHMQAPPQPVPPQVHPPQPLGVEPWEGAPAHICAEWLDADDICEQCGRRVQGRTGPVPVY